LMERAKLGLFVLALLTGIIFALEGCISTSVSVLHDEIPCILTKTEFDLFPSQIMLYEKTVIDCSRMGGDDELGEEDSDTGNAESDSDSGDERADS
jgi:hypothetical protein